MNNHIKTFVIKIGFLAAPLIVLLGMYVYFDPFKILRKYEVFFESGKPSYVTLNKGYVSAEMFLRNHPKYQYDSVTFGNSRSIFYPVSDWKKHIQARECFHFDAASETLFGIYKKLEFFDKKGFPLKNALIVLDSELLVQSEDWKGYLTRQPPVLTAESDLSFHSRFLKGFFNGKFLVTYLDFKIRGKIVPYMTQGSVLSDKEFSYNPVANELSYDVYEKMIAKNRDDYYLPPGDRFPPQSAGQLFSDAVIGQRQKEQLAYIRKVFDQKGTDYRIIVSPLYDQKKLNRKDYEVICRIFGADRVFDFSGKNEITSSRYNYYEWSHYRPHVSRMILAQIYGSRPSE